jgi:hypothetical protein
VFFFVEYFHKYRQLPTSEAQTRTTTKLIAI